MYSMRAPFSSNSIGAPAVGSFHLQRTKRGKDLGPVNCTRILDHFFQYVRRCIAIVLCQRWDTAVLVGEFLDERLALGSDVIQIGVEEGAVD